MYEEQAWCLGPERKSAFLCREYMCLYISGRWVSEDEISMWSVSPSG